MRKRENHWFIHPGFKPTGYFLKEGIAYEITLNRKVTADEADIVKLTVGQWGQYKNPMINQTEDNFSNYEISKDSKKVSLTAENPGVLYVNDSNQTNLRVTNITTQNQNDIIKIPTFKLNKSNQNNFINDVLKTNSPLVEFVSDHFIATMQTEMIQNKVIPLYKRDRERMFNEVLQNWDKGWHLTNKIWGLDENDTGINHKYPQYIHIANEDKSGGYANTTDGRLMFHNASAAGEELFIWEESNYLNPLWHELAHTYQTPGYRFSNVGETTNEIITVYVKQTLWNVKPKVFSFRDTVKEYLNKSDEKRDFLSLKEDHSYNTWTKISMFWQLHMAFGDNFYPLLNQKYRKISWDLNWNDGLNSDEVKVQEFIKITSQLTGYNLAQFFVKWGLPPNQATIDEVRQYKDLTRPIWDNVVDPKTENSPIVQKKLIYKEQSNYKKENERYLNLEKNTVLLNNKGNIVYIFLNVNILPKKYYFLTS
ncbi:MULTISPECIES: M60 family metallopeptidase [unclassified Spiroplasma]